MIPVILLCLVLAALFLYQEGKENYVSAVIVKGLASLCFVVLGLICSPGSHPARLVVIGLVLGCVADVLLNLRMVFKEKGQLIFLVGILVFLSGHILYLAAVLPMSPNWILCFAVAAVLTTLLMIWLFKQISAKPAFKIFGVFYIGAIMLLNCVAFGNLFAAPSAFTGLFAAGAAFFLVSDVVLILNTFGPETRRSLRVTNISLYYIGQLLIALSLRFLV
ncbi:MAG: lysoplasmalogenase [Oscillospiraceae bacterium]|nr:lysoplasmalogenase [Oscillospiraceae bacterium]